MIAHFSLPRSMGTYTYAMVGFNHYSSLHLCHMLICSFMLILLSMFQLLSQRIVTLVNLNYISFFWVLRLELFCADQILPELFCEVVKLLTANGKLPFMLPVLGPFIKILWQITSISSFLQATWKCPLFSMFVIGRFLCTVYP